MYLNRALEDTLLKTIKHYPVILLTGARQVGKTTLLKNIAGDKFKFISMDSLIQRRNLEEDPILFFRSNSQPLILDEIQYVPQSFTTIKQIVDERGQTGQFLLTGSQSFNLMQGVSESLAGRIAIFKLQGLSLRERLKVDFNEPFIPNKEYLDKRASSLIPYDNIWDIIHRGSMPQLALNKEMDWHIYYESYLQTYIERDLRQLTEVAKEKNFLDFMVSLAARSAELLNYQSIAKDIGVSAETIKRWTSILETSGIIYLLYPYHNNHLKRVLKTPKVYFMDTGLLVYLTRWLTPETLRVGAFSGNVFESFVIAEVIKSFQNKGISRPPLYFYRDHDQKEIDLIIEDGQDIYPVEIKLSANPNKQMAKNFSVLQNIKNKNIKHGSILCLYNQLMWLAEDLVSIPLEYL